MRKTAFLTAAGGRLAITAALTMAAAGLAGTTVAEASAVPVAGASTGTSAVPPAPAGPAANSGMPATTPMQPSSPVAPATTPMQPSSPVAPATTPSVTPTRPAAPFRPAAPATHVPSGPAAPAVIPVPTGPNITTETTGTPDPTTVTFAVNVGLLQISVPTTANLGTGNTGTSITAALGTVTVTDNRAELAPVWTATAVSSNFTTGAAGTAETIPNSDVSYWSGPALATSDPGDTGATFVPGQLTSADAVVIAAPQTAFSLTAGIGENSVTWDPTLVVAVPDGAVAGTYTGTVTHSVA